MASKIKNAGISYVVSKGCWGSLLIFDDRSIFKPIRNIPHFLSQFG